ncbi:aspartate/glutamate racemase family protein [Dyella lutea]|uniref:Aspartate/glutamate racemase family protein n=1 Tax=Dyella lutea TaxID=2950441 RepID=A0ABT1FAI8_9GAMM|nr:aspartate/glutamate racemase family protein [Dyella lutea]MCP1373307.1 aspartate/glutamate racemase family protein [Dyella lutea]
MRTIGLLGGMSWESTVPYYRLINEAVRQRLGGLHSARLLLHSVDFAEIEALQRSGDWEAAGRQLAAAARRLEVAGAELLLIGTNTMHKVAPAVEAAIGIPLLHVGDATARAVRAADIARVGLLGTRFTMEQAFYVDRLASHGLEVLVPSSAEREEVHRVIYQELCAGRFEPASRARFRQVMADLVARGAQGVILGCTEIGLLVDVGDASVPLFDTTRLHALAAVELALGG